jgi:dephospho-CoA kinase
MIYEGEAAPAIEAAFPGTTVDGKVDRERLSAKVVHDPSAIKRLDRAPDAAVLPSKVP